MAQYSNEVLQAWRIRCGVAAIAGALAAGTGWAQQVTPAVDPAFVGRWSGESISDDRGVQRWIVERGADGRYTANRSTYGREGAVEQREEGRWSVRDGVLTNEPTNDGTPRQAWRTATLPADCMQLQALDPGSGRSLAPAWRFGECRVPGPRPLPERTAHRCVIEAPGEKPDTLDLQIVREADGQYHAIGDGQRDPQAVEVRDYPVLPDFKPQQVQTMTNAGEGLLVLVQMNVDKSDALRRTLGFDPAQARSVRAWVITPPRPQRPMEYYSAGRFVLMQAFDAEGRLLGGAAYMPFILACPAQP